MRYACVRCMHFGAATGDIPRFSTAPTTPHFPQGRAPGAKGFCDAYIYIYSCIHYRLPMPSQLHAALLCMYALRLCLSFFRCATPSFFASTLAHLVPLCHLLLDFLRLAHPVSPCYFLLIFLRLACPDPACSREVCSPPRPTPHPSLCFPTLLPPC